MDIKPQNPAQPTNPNPPMPPAPQPMATPPAPQPMAPEPMATPPSSTSIPVSTPADSVSTPAPQPMATPPAPQPMAPEPMATPPSSTSIPVSTPADSVSTPAPQPTQNSNQVQAPTVFDTNQYHLPIEKQKKHNPGKQMLVFGVVFIFVLVVGGLLALDAELIDLGFELPFDLIK